MSTQVDKRLKAAIEWSNRKLEFPRKKRVDQIRQYVGSHYAESGAERRVPINMLELAVTIYVRALASRAPQVLVSTGTEELKPFAANMALALNQIPKEIGLGKTLRMAVLEAMFGIGVAKVGLCASGDTQLGHDPGRPFVDLVTPDDYFFDMAAKNRRQIEFEGNDYWLSLDSAKEIYDGSAKDVHADEHTVYGENGEERAEGVSSSEDGESLGERVWLRDVWLPGRQEVLTYGVRTGKVFRVVPWDGPERGPYHSLMFTDVPGNMLPLPPSSLWIDLHELSNCLFRKLANQAEAKKRIVAFNGASDEEATRLKNASDGEGIRYNGTAPTNIDVGGIDPATLAFFLQSKDMFNYVAGNLDALGGLAPMTDTVGQDELLSKGAAARLANMKSDTLEFAGGIFESLAWYEWTDPLRQRVIHKPVPGTDMVLRRVWSEETREGDFLDYNLDIDPYSMGDDSPELRLQKIRQTLTEIVFPLLPVMQQQGVAIDFRKLFGTVSRLSNLSELGELFVFGEPLQGDPQQGGSSTPSFKPAETKRTYERVNRPGATRHGKDDAMSRILMGGGVQRSEAAAIGRPST